jgi:hypothetical protein
MNRLLLFWSDRRCPHEVNNFGITPNMVSSLIKIGAGAADVQAAIRHDNVVLQRTGVPPPMPQVSHSQTLAHVMYLQERAEALAATGDDAERERILKEIQKFGGAEKVATNARDCSIAKPFLFFRWCLALRLQPMLQLPPLRLSWRALEQVL